MVVLDPGGSAPVGAAGSSLSVGGMATKVEAARRAAAFGVTTVVAGNCGFSAIPAEPSIDPNVASGGILAGLNDATFTDLAGYFDAVIKRKPAINNMMLVGHNTIRSITMGLEPNTPTARQLDIMRSHVERAMEQGACGFSTGLIYRPGRYSHTDEVIELTRAVTDYDGLYATHMRNEGEGLLEAIEETLTLAELRAAVLAMRDMDAAMKGTSVDEDAWEDRDDIAPHDIVTENPALSTPSKTT